MYENCDDVVVFGIEMPLTVGIKRCDCIRLRTFIDCNIFGNKICI